MVGDKCLGTVISEPLWKLLAISPPLTKCTKKNILFRKEKLRKQNLPLAEKNRLIAEWKQSNKRQKTFCEEKGKVKTFSKWITNYNKAQNNFVEITPPKAMILECAELTPDNNAWERSIRPFVFGRKNWLFSGSVQGAKNSCFLFSLIETAKKHNGNL